MKHECIVAHISSGDLQSIDKSDRTHNYLPN